MMDPLWARTSDKSKPQTDLSLKLFIPGLEIKSQSQMIWGIDRELSKAEKSRMKSRQIQVTGMGRINLEPLTSQSTSEVVFISRYYFIVVPYIHYTHLLWHRLISSPDSQRGHIENDVVIGDGEEDGGGVVNIVYICQCRAKSLGWANWP